MRQYPHPRLYPLLLTAALVAASCARPLIPHGPKHGPPPQADAYGLTAFRAGGVERTLDMGATTPAQIIATARGYLGVPHCMGGTTPRCMDCSGLLVAVFAQHGVPLPHSAEEQARFGAMIGQPERLRPGDLVFFVNTYKTSRFITHSGIYQGGGEFIHTSSSRGVTITPLANPWWAGRFIFGTRIF